MRTTYGKIHVLITAIVWTLEEGAGVQAQQEADSCTSATQQDDATVDPKIAVDFGSGSKGYYGIPISFNLDTYCHEVTMCSWIRHTPDQLQTGKLNYYLSYKYYSSYWQSYYYNSMGLYTGADSDGKEITGMWLAGSGRHYYSGSSETVYDGNWHSICGSWKRDGGKVALYRDGKPIWENENWQQDYVYPGGTLVIGQQWGVGGFIDNSYCQGQIGAVEIWDHYMDSNEIQCVSNCWGIGNAFHLNWNRTLQEGKLSELTWTSNICCDDGVTSQKTGLDFGDGSTEQYGYPKNFSLTMDRYELTTCAWVRHGASHLQKSRYSYYLSYKLSSYLNILGLYTGHDYQGTENIGMWVVGLHFGLSASPANTVYDRRWHSICGSWRSSDGRASLYRDGVEVGNRVIEGLNDKGVQSGGELVICQQFKSGGGFRSTKYCYGEVGAVEIWDYYMDSNKILCVSNCGSVGNLYHMDWNMMKSEGNLDSLPKTEHLCRNSSTTSVSASATTTWTILTKTTSTTKAIMTSSSTVPAVSTSTDSASSTVYELMNTSTPSGNVSTLQEYVDGRDLMMMSSQLSGGGMIGGIVGGVGGFLLIIVIIAAVILRRKKILGRTLKTDAGTGNDYEIPVRPTVQLPGLPSLMDKSAGDGNRHQNSAVNTTKKSHNSTPTVDETITEDDYMTPISCSQKRIQKCPAPDVYENMGKRDQLYQNRSDSVGLFEESISESMAFNVGVDSCSQKPLEQEETYIYDTVDI